MTAQEVLCGLIEEELQVQGTRIRQRHREAGQRPAGSAHQDMAEAGPIGLRLLARKGFQTQERLAVLGTQAGHGAPQLNHAAGITAVASHLENAGRQQPRMLIQGLSNELGVRIDDGRPQYLRTAQTR